MSISKNVVLGLVVVSLNNKASLYFSTLFTIAAPFDLWAVISRMAIIKLNYSHE